MTRKIERGTPEHDAIMEAYYKLVPKRIIDPERLEREMDEWDRRREEYLLASGPVRKGIIFMVVEDLARAAFEWSEPVQLKFVPCADGKYYDLVCRVLEKAPD